MEAFKQNLTAIYTDILRFAQIQLRDDDLACDIVQDTLATAISKRKQFREEAGLKTWVFSILKNKITDYFRGQKEMVSLEGLLEANAAIDDAYSLCFDDNGHWLPQNSPPSWQQATPEDALTQQEFFRALENCMRGLPQDTARIFYLREIMGWEVADICQEFGINKEHCYVILHRARNGLRDCLQYRWFDLTKEDEGA